MQRRDLTATAWMGSRLGAGALVLVGLFFVFRPEWLGWSRIAEVVGGETALVSAGAGCAFLLVAGLAVEKDRMRVRMAELMEGLNDLLYGKDHRRDREAIEILLRSLGSEDPDSRATAHKHLMRLTGQSFPADPKVWASWWAAHQRTWSRVTAESEQAEGGE
jgi:hypothetical protein